MVDEECDEEFLSDKGSTLKTIDFTADVSHKNPEFKI